MCMEKATAKRYKKLVLEKAKINDGTIANNIKLGHMGSWSMLFGNIEWFIPQLECYVKGTCSGYCCGCFNPEDPGKSPCYVAKSYVKYTNRNEDGTIGDIVKNSCMVKLGHAYRTIAMTMFRDDLYKSLDKQLTNKKKKFEIIRINESGELTCYEDLKLWCDLANAHRETIFYLYTKNYDAVRKAIKNDIIPYNLFVNISVWHNNGIKEFLEFKENAQIRAFVLIDEEWSREEYALHGLVVTGMCGAYDSNGKMNHNVTCEKCRRCFNRKNAVIGCFEH